MKKILVIILCLATIVSSFAVPADPRPHTIKQPNGKTLTYYLRGDERIHWCETLDGYTLLNNEQGYLEFACKNDDGDLVPSGVLACNEDERTEEELNFTTQTDKHLFFSQKQVDARKQFPKL